MPTVPQRWCDLNEDFEAISDQLIQSVLTDATSTNGWSIDAEHNLTRGNRQGTEGRKQAAQLILNARVEEQFVKTETYDSFILKRERYTPRFFQPSEIPTDVEGIIRLFTNVKVNPVESEMQKNLYSFLRHTWRIPFNTTPGRTLSFIVTAGDNERLIGIFSLASPAMWMASRDEHLGYEKLDLHRNRDINNQISYETKDSWIQRWKSRGMVDNIKRPHPLSGKFSVHEFLEAMKTTLIQRICQFPVISFHDRPDLIEKSIQYGINLEDTTPMWLNGIEPNSNKTQRKDKEKRRRITEKCLQALEALDRGDSVNYPDSVESLFETLHGQNGSNEYLKALKYGLREAKTKRISGDIAELAICGSLPPLNKLRVGKLVAMLALSKETQSAWNAKYSQSDSKIASDLAGKPMRKKAKLSSMSTTGLYGASNAQYSRIRIPRDMGSDLRWQMVGLTGTSGRGPSNLMLSSRTWALIKSYSESNTISGVSGKFGEGTSARIRRMKAVFSHLDEHSKLQGYTEGSELNKLLNALVENPFSRSVHVANLAPNSVRYNLNIDGDIDDADTAPSIESIVEFWTQRWLLPFISRSEGHRLEVIDEIKAFQLEEFLPPFRRRADG